MANFPNVLNEAYHPSFYNKFDGRRNFLILLARQLQSEDVNLYIDPQNAILPKNKKNVAIVFEPQTVIDYKKINEHCFDLVFTWNRKIFGENVRYIEIPYCHEFARLKNDMYSMNKKIDAVVVINTFSFGRFKNGIKRNGYLRRYLFILLNMRLPIHIYGNRWPSRLISFLGRIGFKIEYKGNALDKLEVISRYKYTLCFENTLDPMYKTEKIFDALSVRSLPLVLETHKTTPFVYACKGLHLSKRETEKICNNLRSTRLQVLLNQYPIDAKKQAKLILREIKKL